MLIFKRNQIVITSLIIVIVCAGYLNYKYNKTKLTSVENPTPIGTAYFVENSSNKNLKSEQNTTVAKINGDYFIITRAEKERTRDELKEMLEDIINSKNADKKAREEAQERLIQITKNAEKEMIIEEVLKGKGFADIIAFVNDDKVDIIVKDEENLISSQKAMILDIVIRETGVPAENIKINPYKKPKDPNAKT